MSTEFSLLIALVLRIVVRRSCVSPSVVASGMVTT